MNKILLFCAFIISTGCNFAPAPLATRSATPVGSEIVETIVGKNISDGRYIFVHLPENSFTKEGVLSVVKQYQSDCDPYRLTLEIYSDRDLLQKAIQRERVPIATDFGNTDEDRKAQKRFEEQKYWPSGSMIARYHRSDYHESLKVQLSKSGPRESVNLREFGLNTTCSK